MPADAAGVARRRARSSPGGRRARPARPASGAAPRRAGQAARAKPPGWPRRPSRLGTAMRGAARERRDARASTVAASTSGWSTGWSSTASAPRALRRVEAAQDGAEHAVGGSAGWSRTARPRAARPPRDALGLVAERRPPRSQTPGRRSRARTAREEGRRPEAERAPWARPCGGPRPRPARRPRRACARLNHGSLPHSITGSDGAMKQKHLLSLRDYSRGRDRGDLRPGRAS